jgi:CBS domain-containing protein
MQPLDHLSKVEPNTELLAALQMMDETNVSHLPVVDDNRILGLLSRDGIFNYLRLRSELGA